ncbi:MAG: hypothetical protein ACP5JB_01735 [candidate division WOR-3 bacterium]
MSGLWPLLIALLVLTGQLGERTEWIFTVEPPKCEYQIKSPIDTTLQQRLLVAGSDSVWVNGALLDRTAYFITPDGQQITIFVPLPEFTPVRVVFREVILSRIIPGRKSVSLKSAGESEADSVRAVIRLDSSAASAGNWTISGDKLLGFSVGSDVGLGIEQATRISLNGEVENITVEAELSDQSAPIPAEGTTLELKELDQILIRFKGKGWGGRFGNVGLNADAGSFGRVQRNVIGGVLEGGTAVISGSAVYARPQGEFGRVILKGIDGIQGPYILAPDGRSAQIVPGSEVVYLDGRRMTRGWDADYTIDYATGEVVFTNRNIITSRSRIEAEFEYLTFNYERSVITGQLNILPGPFQFQLTMFQEGDNPARSLNPDLNEETKQQLAEIGSDTGRAWVGGGEFVGPNRGDYIREGNHYRFVGSNAGDYRVRFTYVGESLGSYIYQDSLIGFLYVGPKAGDYVDSIKIPLPQLQQIGYVKAGFNHQGWGGFIEGAFLRRNVNLFASSSGNVDAGGLAYGFNLTQDRFTVEYRHQGRTEGFLLPASSDDIDFNYRWGGVMPGELQMSDEIALGTELGDARLNFALGRLKKLDNSYVERYGGGGQIWWLNFSGFQAGEFLRLDAGIQPQIARFYPVLRWEQEDDRLNRSHSLQAGVRLQPHHEVEVSGDYRLTGYSVKDTINDRWQVDGDGQLLQLKYRQELGEKFHINGLAGFQRRGYVRAENNWCRYFSSINAGWSPLKGLDLSVDLSQTNRRVQLKDELFHYVGPDKGGYRRDSLTGSYLPDPHGDYELVIVNRGKFTDVRELELTVNGNWAGAGPMAMSGYYTRNLGSGDSAQLNTGEVYDFRLFWNNLEPSIKAEAGVQGSSSSDRTRRITGRAVSQHGQFLQLTVGVSPDAEFTLRSEHSQLLRLLYSGELDYIEEGWELELTSVLGAKLRLEPGVKGGVKWLSEPFGYPELGRFSIRSIGWWISRSFIIGRQTRIRPRVEIIDRWSDVSALPDDVKLTHPLGVLPSATIELEHLWSEIFSLSGRYIYSHRPGYAAEHNFTLTLQARF